MFQGAKLLDGQRAQAQKEDQEKDEKDVAKTEAARVGFVVRCLRVCTH